MMRLQLKGNVPVRRDAPVSTAVTVHPVISKPVEVKSLVPKPVEPFNYMDACRDFIEISDALNKATIEHTAECESLTALCKVVTNDEERQALNVHIDAWYVRFNQLLDFGERLDHERLKLMYVYQAQRSTVH